MAEEKKTVKKAPAKKEAAKKEAAKKEPAAKKAAAPKKAAKKVEAKAETPVKAEAKMEAKKEAKKEKAEVVEAKPAVTEARCFVRDIRITPRKVRLVIDLVRGKSVSEALGILSRTNRVAAQPVAKAIKSAAANAVNNFHMEAGSIYVAEIQVSDGLRIKRFIPRAKGSASPIIKRNANLRVVVKAR